MRHLLWFTVCVLLIVIVLAPARADPVDEPPFQPVSPEVMAQGGAFVASARGYNALFYNPAGFARPGGSLTLASLSTWLYGNPDRLLEAVGGRSGSTPLSDFLNTEITSGGIGFGAAAGIGYVGRGLGLGVALMMDSYLYGDTAMDATGDITVTLGFVAGLALPVRLLGMKLNLGADFRPLVRVRAPVDYQTVFDVLDALQNGGDPLAALNGVSALHGFGIGLDLGAIAELGSFSLGLSVRDFLGTRFSYAQSTTGDILNALQSSGNFPNGEPVSGEFAIPMNVSLGAAWHPDLGGLRAVFDPVIHADLQDVIGVIQDGRSPWTLLHIGAEVELLSFLKLRAGLNQGYLTLGGGLKLLLLDINVALFTREAGKHLGDRPNSGLTIEGAVRL
jgi:hypothetical protein